MLLSKPASTCYGLMAGALNRGGLGGGGVATPLNFGWGLDTCQPPLILRKFLLGGGGLIGTP